jgi:dephospho-CoA kinase
MKLVLGIVGEIGSGKGTFAEYVKKKYGGDSFSFSHILRRLLDIVQLEKNRKNLQKISTVLRKNVGEDLLAKTIYLEVKESRKKWVVVDGVRRLEDIKYLKKIKGFRLVYLEADIEKRFKRIVRRKDKADDGKKKFATFKKDHLAETELQIKKIKKHADFILSNNDTKKEFFEKIDKIFPPKADQPRAEKIKK